MEREHEGLKYIPLFLAFKSSADHGDSTFRRGSWNKTWWGMNYVVSTRCATQEKTWDFLLQKIWKPSARKKEFLKWLDAQILKKL